MTLFRLRKLGAATAGMAGGASAVFAGGAARRLRANHSYVKPIIT
jgi:hypothetical protein